MALYGQKAVIPNALSANQCLIFVGTQPIAFAQTVTHTFDMGAQQLYGVGSAMIQEIQQLRINPSITLDSFELSSIGDVLIELNAPGITLASFIANNSFTITIKQYPGNDLFVYVGCQASNFSESIPTNQMVTKTITFSALDVLDSRGKSILNTPPFTQNFGEFGGVFTAVNIAQALINDTAAFNAPPPGTITA